MSINFSKLEAEIQNHQLHLAQIDEKVKQINLERSNVNLILTAMQKSLNLMRGGDEIVSTPVKSDFKNVKLHSLTKIKHISWK